jgi:hypothetical protein
VGPLKEAGAVVCYHSSGKVSAMKIVNHLMKLPKCTLAVQKEMDGADKKFSDTKASQQIIELWGEELSANEEEIKKQMELQLGDSDQQRTEHRGPSTKHENAAKLCRRCPNHSQAAP